MLDSYLSVIHDSTFSIHYALTNLITAEEVLIFPFDSLVSEFGGALRHFLGALSMMQNLQIEVKTILFIVKTNKHEIGPLTN